MRYLKITKIDILLFLTLVLPILADILNGFVVFLVNVNLPISALYRGIVISVSIFMIIHGFIKNGKLPKFMFIIFYYCVLLVFWFVFSEVEIGTEMNYFFKITYAYWLFYILYIFIEQYTIDHLIRFIKIYLSLISFCLYFSFLTGIGLPSHDGYTFGTSSFFIAINTIGVSVLSLLAVILFRAKGWKDYVFCLIIGFSLFLLASLTAILGVLMIFFIRIVVHLYLERNKNVVVSIKKGIFTIIFFVGFVSLVYYIYLLMSQYYFYVRKITLYIEQGGARTALTTVAKEYMAKRPFMFNLFGEGKSSFLQSYSAMFESGKKSMEEASVENDIYDFIGAYGIFFFIFLVWWYAKYFIRAILIYFSTYRVFILGIILSFLILFGHAFVAGHVFGGPMAISTFAILCIMVIKLKNSDGSTDKKELAVDSEKLNQ